MNWSDEEKDRARKAAEAAFVGVQQWDEDVRADCREHGSDVRIHYVADAMLDFTTSLLASRGGTMTEEDLKGPSQAEFLTRGWGPWRERVREHFSALGARNAALEAENAELKARLREYHSDVAGDDIKYAETYDGVRGIVRWVKDSKRELEKTKAGIFDTGLRCVSEGGDVFYFDPEELEETVDRIAVLEAELSEARATIARLTAAGEVLSAHVDAHECDASYTHSGIDDAETTRRDKEGWQEPPARYPCSPTCTHDDAATPGHPERVKERSEAFTKAAAGMDFHMGYESGAEAMRAAVEAWARDYFGSVPPTLKVAVEGATHP